MKIEIIKFSEYRDPDSPLQGSVLVELGDKMRAWFSILRSKKGTSFCNPGSVRIDGEFKPSFSLTDERKMKILCADILRLVKQEYSLE